MRLFQVAKCVVGDDDNSRIFVIGIKRIFHLLINIKTLEFSQLFEYLIQFYISRILIIILI